MLVPTKANVCLIFYLLICFQKLNKLIVFIYIESFIPLAYGSFTLNYWQIIIVRIQRRLNLRSYHSFFLQIIQNMHDNEQNSSANSRKCQLNELNQIIDLRCVIVNSQSCNTLQMHIFGTFSGHWFNRNKILISVIDVIHLHSHLKFKI